MQVFLPKCPLTTVRSCFSADVLQIVRGKAEDTFGAHFAHAFLLRCFDNTVLLIRSVDINRGLF